MALTAETYLWEHWKFNADQRLKAFNFFVAFAIFANGMVFTALEKHAHPLVLIFLGGLASILALVFAIVDHRSRQLLHLVKQGLKEFEKDLPLVAALSCWMTSTSSVGCATPWPSTCCSGCNCCSA